MTKNSNRKNDLWVKCPPGAIQKVVNNSMVSRAPAVNSEKRKFMAAMATAAGVVVLGGVAYITTKDGQASGGKSTATTATTTTTGIPVASNYLIGGIYCEEVRSLAKDYHAKAIGDEKLEKIEKHLKICSKCQRHYDSVKSS